jgi:hypothetical protein
VILILGRRHPPVVPVGDTFIAMPPTGRGSRGTGPGITATLTANMAQGWSNGPVGVVVAAWPTVSLVGSCGWFASPGRRSRRQRYTPCGVTSFGTAQAATTLPVAAVSIRLTA